MIKFISLIFLAFIGSIGSIHAIPSRISEGKVQFAEADVSGFTAWTQAEKTDLIALHGAGNVTNYTPANFEVNLSTCLTIIIDGQLESGWENYTEWISCQTKAGLKKKIRKLRQFIDSMSDLPAADSRDLKERAGWIKAYFLTLP